MIHATYIGNAHPHLRHTGALIRYHEEKSKKVLAQFDQVEIRTELQPAYMHSDPVVMTETNPLAFGWHEFNLEDFIIDKITAET